VEQQELPERFRWGWSWSYGWSLGLELCSGTPLHILRISEFNELQSGNSQTRNLIPSNFSFMAHAFFVFFGFSFITSNRK